MADPREVQATVATLSLDPELMYGIRPFKNMQLLLRSYFVYV
jgi:hypothetical protein